MKNVIVSIVMMIAVSLSLVADSSYDRTIEVMDKTREQEVKRVFRELIASYQDEDARGFLDSVSEDRFLQDYITLTDAIYQDFRLYDILEIKYWIDSVMPKGNNKRYLSVRWDKYSTSLANSDTYHKKGYSRFLFDEINGEYKLIEYAGNILFGDSSEELIDDGVHIPGELEEVVKVNDEKVVKVTEVALKPDLIVTNVSVVNASASTFDIENIGNGNVLGAIEWVDRCGNVIGTHNGGLDAGDTVTINYNAYQNSCTPQEIAVDPDNLIDESNENNNVTSY